MSAGSASGQGGGRRYGGASADERRADRRERLIRAAIALYGEQGYRRTTVAAVCRTAGLTPRYFYEAFANSEALLAATFHEVAEYVMQRVEAAAAAPGTPDERLAALLATYYGLLREDRATARVFLSELSGVDARVDALFARSIATFADLIVRTLDPGRVGDAIAPLRRAETIAPLRRAETIAPLRRAGAMQGLLAVARDWVARDCVEPVAEVVRTATPLARMLVA